MWKGIHEAQVCQTAIFANINESGAQCNIFIHAVYV